MRAWMLLVATFALVAVGVLLSHVLAASPVANTTVDAASAAPRSVEESTVHALERDYGRCWAVLAAAGQSNQPGELASCLTGGALEQWRRQLAEQQQNGMSRRILDHGHQLKINFYSVDGSAMEATDDADLEIQYLQGGQVLTSERIRSRYLVLLTPAENSWQVRALQELPDE